MCAADLWGSVVIRSPRLPRQQSRAGERMGLCPPFPAPAFQELGHHGRLVASAPLSRHDYLPLA